MTTNIDLWPTVNPVLRDRIGTFLEDNLYMAYCVAKELLLIMEERPITPATVQRLRGGSVDSDRMDFSMRFLADKREEFIKILEAFTEKEEMLDCDL